jgi:ABC-2 type transport system ATP-binding protein
MPRPAALASAALLTGLTGLALVGAPATAATPARPSDHQQSFTKTAITVETMVGPNNDVPCTVRADKYQPAGVSKAHPAPAILTTNGFGGAKDDDGQSAGASAFAKAGYVVISYSGLGFGGSDCKIALDDPDYDGKAGKQMVDVPARAPTRWTTALGARRRSTTSRRRRRRAVATRRWA